MRLRRKLAGFHQIRQFDNWVQVAANRIAFPNTGCIVYRLGDTEMIVDHLGGDENGLRACIASSMYRELLDAIPDRASIGTLLDIGANAGGFPLLAYLMEIPLQRVACVEMNPKVFGRLAFNLHQNLDGVSLCLINGAIAAKRGTVELGLGRGSTGQSLLDSTLAEAGRRAAIDLLTFDDIVDRAFPGAGTVDLCKVDVEGSEYEVFFGTECKASNRVRYLIIEIHDSRDHSRNALLERLRVLGFSDMSPRARAEPSVFLLRNRTPVVNRV